MKVTERKQAVWDKSKNMVKTRSECPVWHALSISHILYILCQWPWKDRGQKQQICQRKGPLPHDQAKWLRSQWRLAMDRGQSQIRHTLPWWFTNAQPPGIRLYWYICGWILISLSSYHGIANLTWRRLDKLANDRQSISL